MEIQKSIAARGRAAMVFDYFFLVRTIPNRMPTVRHRALTRIRIHRERPLLASLSEEVLGLVGVSG